MQKSNKLHFTIAIFEKCIRVLPVFIKNMEPSNPKKIIHLNPENATELSAEDQLWFYWQKVRGPLTVLLVTGLVGLGGYQAFNWFQAKRTNTIQEAYLASCENDERLVFAKTYPNDPLAGIALMEEALIAQSKSNWEDAAKLYEMAIKPLSGSVLSAQAQLQYGKCSASLEDTHNAARAFEAVFANTNALQSFRAEAAYERILLALQVGDHTQVKEWFDKLMQMEEAGFWLQKAQMLQL